MDLPDADLNFIERKGLSCTMLPDGAGSLLIVSAYRVNLDRYDRSEVDLMIRIPAQYNISSLDMFYVSPTLRLKNGSFPPQAEVMELHAGRQWQRFSRHLPAWRAGIDGLPTLFAHIQRELRGE